MMSTTKKAVVYVSLKDGVLDPQGQTIQKALDQMGYHDFVSVKWLRPITPPSPDYLFPLITFHVSNKRAEVIRVPLNLF